MVDSLKLQQPLTVGLHSSSKTGSTSVSSESLLLSKKGKKLVGGYDFTPELQSIVNSILELDMCPPPLIHTAKDDESLVGSYGEQNNVIGPPFNHQGDVRHIKFIRGKVS